MKKNIKLIMLLAIYPFLSTTSNAQITIDKDVAINNIQNIKSNFFLDNLTDEQIQKEFNLANEELFKNNKTINDGEAFIIVDRGKPQLMMIVYPESKDEWELLKASHVSTGKPGRKEHFKTPTGVFKVNGDILGYRALGTFNKNHIRGNGLKGSRVYDLGWQSTDDWRTKNHKIDIRMEMHATDPSNLEKRIGRADSEGCIRTPSSMIKLIDKYGILDKHTNNKALNGSAAWNQLLGKEHIYNPIAGDTIIVIDSTN